MKAFSGRAYASGLRSLETLMPPRVIAFAALLVMVLGQGALAIGGGEDLTADAGRWRVMPSDGVEATISADPGGDGSACLRLDFNFKTGGGFVVVQRDFVIDLPENYEFAFRVKGDCKRNNLEFKLLDPPTAPGDDPTTSSVWWVNKPAYEFSREWTPTVYKRRHFSFAWGPSGGKPHARLGKIEFAIASSQGGKGTVWFEGLTFRELPVVKAYEGTPTATATSSLDAEHGAEKAVDGDEKTAWYSKWPGAAITIDFGQVREFGGLVLEWTSLPPGCGQSPFRLPYDVRCSSDGTRWTGEVSGWAGSGDSDFVFLPDSEARFVRIGRSTDEMPFPMSGALGEVRVVPVESATSLNVFIGSIAKDLPRGLLPRWAYGEQSFWTVLGVPGDRHEALINEEGQIEVGKLGFSLEPFVLEGEKLLTWADGTHTQTLADGCLPIATVVREMDGLRLAIRAGVAGPSDESAVVVQYTLTNTSAGRKETQLLVGIRPYQVNPPAQFLNVEGGVSSIRELGAVHTASGGVRADLGFQVNGEQSVFTSNALGMPMHEFSWEEAGGDTVGELVGTVWSLVTSRGGGRSAVCRVPTSLAAGESFSTGFVVTFEGTGRPTWLPRVCDSVVFQKLLDVTEEVWRKELSHATLSLPASAKAIEDTFYAQQAYIMINRDGPGFQPGSRSYERSWIRDGSMTSAAMLQLGHTEMVKEFVRWYAGHQFPDGKVPCVVDSRGPDPVPEHDSHGQLIMAIANVHRYTGDAAFVREHFENVKRAVAYIEKIRGERMTAEYAALPGTDGAKTKQEPGKPAVPLRAMYGLVPESISHEGYSAKPMHSYWDDLFVYRGLKDAAYCAGVVGEEALRARWAGLAKDFGESLAASYALTMKTHGIDYLPGCVELGDFDATSTTVALWPVQAQDILPSAAVERTFEKYWEFFTHRRDNPRDQWEAYTPYELRTINAFVHLGQRDRAVAALEWFMKDQYPAGWRHWAEVVWSNPRTTKFIGDMPHTWCGSDFLNSLRTMFVYEDEAREALVMFAGVPVEWSYQPEGYSFRGFRTYYGTINASVKPHGNDTRVLIDSPDFRMPPGGIIIRWSDADHVHAKVNGTEPERVPGPESGGFIIRSLPAEIIIDGGWAPEDEGTAPSR
jgi:F5/8 type C domain